MRVQRFEDLLAWDMFMVPPDQGGADCLWIVLPGNESAKSYPSNWGCCHFDPMDEVLEVDTERAAKLVIADQR